VRRYAILAVLLTVTPLLAFGPGERTAPTHWALVVGVSDYIHFDDVEGGDLPGAEHDARVRRHPADGAPERRIAPSAPPQLEGADGEAAAEEARHARGPLDPHRHRGHGVRVGGIRAVQDGRRHEHDAHLQGHHELPGEVQPEDPERAPARDGHRGGFDRPPGLDRRGFDRRRGLHRCRLGRIAQSGPPPVSIPSISSAPSWRKERR